MVQNLCGMLNDEANCISHSMQNKIKMILLSSTVWVAKVLYSPPMTNE